MRAAIEAVGSSASIAPVLPHPGGARSLRLWAGIAGAVVVSAVLIGVWVEQGPCEASSGLIGRGRPATLRGRRGVEDPGGQRVLHERSQLIAMSRLDLPEMRKMLERAIEPRPLISRKAAPIRLHERVDVHRRPVERQRLAVQSRRRNPPCAARRSEECPCAFSAGDRLSGRRPEGARPGGSQEGAAGQRPGCRRLWVAAELLPAQRRSTIAPTRSRARSWRSTRCFSLYA